jgi:hypothetical protein
MIAGGSTGFEDMARRMIESADPLVHARHSFDNFHRRGLLYLNLLRSPDLTCKLYVLRPCWGELLPGGLLVDPHNQVVGLFAPGISNRPTRDASRSN